MCKYILAIIQKTVTTIIFIPSDMFRIRILPSAVSTGFLRRLALIR